MVRIEFCGVCAGFRKEAETLAKYLREQGTKVELIEAGRGRFNACCRCWYFHQFDLRHKFPF